MMGPRSNDRCFPSASPAPAASNYAIVLGQEAALLVECKWAGRPVGTDILRELERKAGLARPELGDRRPFLGLCARSGFTPQVEAEAGQREDLFLFDLARIVGGE